MECLPKKELSTVAAFLDQGSRLLLAVALTAPSSSWEKKCAPASPWETKCDPIDLSPASKIVMEPPFYYGEYEWAPDWGAIDFTDEICLGKSTRRKMSDGDLCGILTAVNAKQTVRTLCISDCVNVIGHGLAPLRGSVVLQDVDISCGDPYYSPIVEPKPKLSESAVLPILTSICRQKGNSFSYVRLPKLWRDERSEGLSAFLGEFHRAMNERKMTCSKCSRLCVRTDDRPWMPKSDELYGIQNTCHICYRPICPDCEAEWGPFLCPRREVRYCRGCGVVKECLKCDALFCNDARVLGTCSACGGVMCPSCSPETLVYTCDCCKREICENCSPLRKCRGSHLFNSRCSRPSCSDCATKGLGAVRACKLCDEAFCTDCKTLERCFDIEGDVCQDCHDKSHDAVECYWRLLPPALKQLVPESACEITLERLVQFSQECTKLLPNMTDKSFNIDTYHQVKQSQFAAYIVAADYLLEGGMDNEAVYMMLYGVGILNEIVARGPDFMMKVSADLVPVQLDWFRAVVSRTRTRSDIIRFLEEEVPFLTKKCGNAQRLKVMLSKVQSLESKIHDATISKCRRFKKLYGDTIYVTLILVNKDDWRNTSGEKVTYGKDTTLGWMLKDYVIHGFYHSCIQGRKITSSTRYFRVVHNGKTLFLSSSGRKTLQELGIQDGDTLTIGGVDSVESVVNAPTSAQKKTNASNSKNTKKRGGSSKKKATGQRKTASSESNDQITKKQREVHSHAMSSVFEELEPLLKQIRDRLNDLTLQKTAPKVKKSGSRKKRQSLQCSTNLSLPNDDLVCGKAGKVVYSILVGEECNLYKTSKHPLPMQPITIDLHGLSKVDALRKLDESLPCWVDAAMNGEYPWIAQIDIICGGGSQVLSEAVKEWIRNNRHVANRPKTV